MITRTLFLIFITLNTLLTNNCFGMELEKEDKIITLDQGLLTIIPGKIVKKNYEPAPHWWENEKTIYKYSEKNDTLLNLLYYDKYSSTSFTYFRPLIIKLTNGQPHNILYHFGSFESFNKKSRRELKEAIRERKALYYTRKEGILIYSLSEQPDPNIVIHIDRMLEENKTTLKIFQ